MKVIKTIYLEHEEVLAIEEILKSKESPSFSGFIRQAVNQELERRGF